MSKKSANDIDVIEVKVDFEDIFKEWIGYMFERNTIQRANFVIKLACKFDLSNKLKRISKFYRLKPEISFEQAEKNFHRKFEAFFHNIVSYPFFDDEKFTIGDLKIDNVKQVIVELIEIIPLRQHFEKG